jgi:hypothetical protein
MHGELRFPQVTYLQHELSLTTDPYKISIGVADVESGEFHNVVLRKYLFQNVMRKLLLVEPRTPTESFCYVCDGEFRIADDFLLLNLYGEFNIPNSFHLERGTPNHSTTLDSQMLAQHSRVHQALIEGVAANWEARKIGPSEGMDKNAAA